MENLIKIQSELKAPKNQFNKFGNYKYRNQEDILESVKPLLLKYGCTLTITDKLKTVNAFMFVESTCIFTDGENSIKVKAQAGIDATQKGMSLAQCFGSSSSYARKYALNGLFLIDDTKDSDATNTHDNSTKAANKPITTPEQSSQLSSVLQYLKNCKTLDDVLVLWDSLDESEQAQTKALFTKRKQEISR
jgi:hypothetical protein